MDAWTIFGAVKLLLDIINEGPKALVKGILIEAALPGPIGEMIEAGELLFFLFGLDGDYCGTVVLNQKQYVALTKVELLNRKQLVSSLAKHNFPELARLARSKMQERQVVHMDNLQMRKREFPKFERRGNG